RTRCSHGRRRGARPMTWRKAEGGRRKENRLAQERAPARGFPFRLPAPAFRPERALQPPRAPAPAASARSQREAEEQRVLAPLEGGIVVGTNRDLLESDRAIQVARADVRRTHLEIDDLAGGRAGDLDHVSEERATHALVLPLGGDGDVEQMRFVER